MEILEQVDLGPHFVGSERLERRKRQIYWIWRSNQINVVDNVFRVSGAANGGGAVGEGDTNGVKGSSKTIFAKFPNGDEGFIVNSREDVCLEGSKRHVRKRQKGSMGETHSGNIGEADKDSMIGGEQIGTGSCGAKEMANVARFGYGAIGRVVKNERSYR